MLARLRIKLKKGTEDFLSYQMSSLFHGFLMEQVSYEYGEVLHQSNLKPFSQCLEIGKAEAFWIIHTLNKEAYENLILPLLAEKLEEVYLEKKDIHIPIISKEIQTMKYDDLMGETVFSSCPRYITIQFGTSTAFKSGGEYLFYPTVKHIFHSCVQKFDAMSEKSQIYTPELMGDIEKYVRIVRYHLQSTGFSLEGTRIPSFRGEITLKIGGPQQLVNLIWFLLKFGEYAGIGIKTALGMGKITIIERKRKDAGKGI